LECFANFLTNHPPAPEEFHQPLFLYQRLVQQYTEHYKWREFYANSSDPSE
jgi:hypothetical protein